MNNEMNETAGTAAIMNSRKKFETTLTEKILAFFMIPISYIYVSALFSLDSDLNIRILFSVFAVLFLAVNEIMHLRKKRTAESIFFLICTLIILAAYASGFPEMLGLDPVWDSEYLLFFLHLFAVYWVMERSGKLYEGKTGHMFLWDGITAFFILPFKNFILQVRVIISCFRREDDKKKNGMIALIIAGAVIVGLILLVIAMSALMAADDNFNAMFVSVSDFIGEQMNWDIIWKVYMALHVSSYLFGLTDGAQREEKARFVNRGNAIKRFLSKLSKVPQAVWISFTGVFSAAYIIFFIIQGSYLFGAFGNILHTGYTYASYARQGFGEMCVVMIINFILLWLAMRTSSKKSTVLKISGTLLLVESLLFAAIACAKLLMYIGNYGFTPLRLQAAWLIIVLVYACICSAVSLFSGKDTAGKWFIGSAALLTVLCFV